MLLSFLCSCCCLLLAQLLMYLHDAEKTAVSSNKMGAGGLPRNQREVANKVRTASDPAAAAAVDQATLRCHPSGALVWPCRASMTLKQTACHAVRSTYFATASSTQQRHGWRCWGIAAHCSKAHGRLELVLLLQLLSLLLAVVTAGA
jgi:hypothetical protein